MKKCYLAIDLGATSGRAIAGVIEDGVLHTREVNRFPNGFIRMQRHLYWDIYQLYTEVLNSITLAMKAGFEPVSLAIDTWGVDFVLFGEDGLPCGLPFAYRDHLTDGMIEKFSCLVMAKQLLYASCGNQLMQINSLFQLYAQKTNDLPAYKNARSLLFIPDALNYLLTGKRYSEYTIASTSSMLHAQSRDWDKVLIEKAGFQQNLFAPIIHPGQTWGYLDKELANHLGVDPFPVIAVASHDTASAVAAVPAGDDSDWAFLSLGTWSLMGIEASDPILNEVAFCNEFTNEGGANNTVLFMKNLTGFWLIEQCMKQWEIQGKYITYQVLDEELLHCKPFLFFLDTDDPQFSGAGNILEAMTLFLQETGQPVPQTPAQWARGIYENLAFKYKETFERLRSMTSEKIRKLHVIGGGTKNIFLCRITADALGVPVIAGPAECTAAGNILMQALAVKNLSDYRMVRQIAQQSFHTVAYHPENTDKWNEQYAKYQEVLQHQCSIL